MSQPHHDIPPAVRDEVLELMDDLAFQKVLLESIDHTVQNREELKQEVREEMKAIEAKIRILKRGDTSSASQLSSQSLRHPSSSSRQPGPGSNFPSGEKKGGAAGDGESAMEGYNHRQSVVSNTSTVSPPNSSNSIGDLVSPSRMSLPSRKRSHSKHLDGDFAPFQGNKSRRTSPSPYTTSPATPSTMSSGDEDFEDFNKEYMKQQSATARALQVKAAREKADEEYARALQESFQTYTPSASSSSAGNAFSRLGMGASLSASLSSNTTPGMQKSSMAPPSGRRLPWNTPSSTFGTSSMKSEPRSMVSNPLKSEGSGFSAYASANSSASSVKREAPSFVFDPPTGVKSEPFMSRPMPGTFQDSQSGSDSDDIEIIPPSAFHDNGRHKKAAPPPPSNALQMAMYGNQVTRPWMNEGSSFSSAMNSGFLQHTRPGPMDGNGFGTFPGNMHTPGAGMGYTMDNLPAYGMSHQNQIGDILSRSGANNFAELSEYLGVGDDANGQLSYIMNDPRKTGEEIQQLLLNIRPDAELPPEDREGTPDGLVYPLYEHQKLALTWLKKMEEGTNKGGILADDMGLGKTISSLALMLSRPSTDRSKKTTLIVGPVALVRQWEREIQKKIKSSHRLSTLMIHGGKKPTWDELRIYDVVLTTYGTLGSEYKRLEKFYAEQKLKGTREYDQAPMKRLFPLLGPKSVFYRVILDEAQCIKNKTTNAAKAAYHVHAIHRLCLTGTPMMNNVGELFSLIHFLRIRPYNDWSRFNNEFGALSKATAGYKRDLDKVMRKLQALLKAILLRRNKTSLIDGKPIITLPRKTEEITHVVFSEDERAFYAALESKTQIQFNKYMKAGTVGKHYSNILVLLLRLRQACCHPHLIQDFETAPTDISVEAMIELAKSLAPEVVARLLAAEDAFECPVCYDGVENPSIITPCGHDTCPECLAKIFDQSAQRNIEAGDEGQTSKCPACRGHLVAGKVIDYATFKKVHKPEAVVDDDETASENSDSDSEGSETESGSETEDEEANSDGDLRDFIVPDGAESTDEEDETDSTHGDEGDDEAEGATTKKSKSKGKGKAKKYRKAKSKSKGKGKKKEKKPHVSIAMLKKEANKSAENRRRYMKYLKKNWQPSAKVTKCVELLDQFLEDGQKTIIFSQFVSLLDLLQVPIEEKKWKCLRYDGSMSAESRNSNINKFTDSRDHNIMLISLKAGNAGLNLVAASRVIILDPFWNPFIEMQAVDRAYRIGQQRPVEVHRILIEGTVEDRIIELQQRKRKLVESALDEGASRDVGRLDVRQLAFLFGVGSGT